MQGGRLWVDERLRTVSKALSFAADKASLSDGISINTLAEPNPDMEPADNLNEFHGERYFVAKTKTGICVVNYQPSIDSYVGGPFLTWGGAYTRVAVYGESRRRMYLLALTVSAGLAGFLYVLL